MKLVPALALGGLGILALNLSISPPVKALPFGSGGGVSKCIYKHNDDVYQEIITNTFPCPAPTLPPEGHTGQSKPDHSECVLTVDLRPLGGAPLDF